jgi:hypothetical protein
MSKVRRWGLTVLTMASVATLVLLVTGWGSAMASSVSSVLVTNTASNPAQVHEAGTANVHVTNTDANGNIKVAEQGTPSVNVQNFPSSQTVSGSVSVDNLPAAPTTDLITDGEVTVPAGQATHLAGGSVSQYREVSFYLSLPQAPGKTAVDVICSVSTAELLPGGGVTIGTPIAFRLDTFTFTGDDTIKTYEPAPPNVNIQCHNADTNDVTFDWMLTGRTG